MVDQSKNRMEMAGRIRELRESAGVSVEETARRLELSIEEYSEYESGLRDVPISVLYGIAGDFGVDMTDLMTGKSPNLHRFCVVRDGKGPEIERFPGYRFQNLAFDFQNRHFEPLLVTIDPARNNDITLVKHGGQEFNYVLSGRVRVVLGGKEIELAKGDSLFFDPSIPHGQLALDAAPAVFLTVIMHDHVAPCDGKQGPAC
jgi:transcriptional regulator with XRE-family HTH domain